MAKVVRIDNCAFTKNPSLIKSAKFDGAIENGTLVFVGGLMEGEREVHEITTDGEGMVGIVCTPEVEYDEKGYHGLETFTNREGDVVRVGILHKGDIFSVTEVDAEDITMGDVVAKHIETDVVGRLTYQVFEVQ